MDKFTFLKKYKKPQINVKFKPKRKYHWTLHIEGFDDFLLKNARRPCVIKEYESVYVENITFEIYDPIAPSGAQQVMEWLEFGGDRRADLKLLNNSGKVVEQWNFSDLNIVRADFGELDYSSNEAMTVKFECAVGEAKLLY